MKWNDIKDKKLLLALKEILGNSACVNTLTCSLAALICTLSLNGTKDVSVKPKTQEVPKTEQVDLYSYRKKLNIELKKNFIGNKTKILEIPTELDEEPIEEDIVIVEEPKEENVKLTLEEFQTLGIAEMQEYILNTYEVSYKDLVNAIAYKADINGTEVVEAIRAREDFSEIEELFNILTDKKLEYVEARRNETYDNLVVSFATVLGEATAYNYSEGYVNMNSVDNRIHSSEWNNGGRRNSIYKQITAEGQYNVYFKGFYKSYLDIKKFPTFYGALDYLVLEVSVHDYVSFRSKGSSYGEQLVLEGNKYRTLLTPETYVEDIGLVPMPAVRYTVELDLINGPVVVYGRLDEELEEDPMSLELTR